MSFGTYVPTGVSLWQFDESHKSAAENFAPFVYDGKGGTPAWQPTDSRVRMSAGFAGGRHARTVAALANEKNPPGTCRVMSDDPPVFWAQRVHVRGLSAGGRALTAPKKFAKSVVFYLALA